MYNDTQYLEWKWIEAMNACFFLNDRYECQIDLVNVVHGAQGVSNDCLLRVNY